MFNINFFIDSILLAKCTSDDTSLTCCSGQHRCGEGKGDCDHDSHCEEGLVCGNQNCKDFDENFPYNYDCCWNPCELDYIIAFSYEFLLTYGPDYLLLIINQSVSTLKACY